MTAFSNYAPELRIDGTISNPQDPVEVIGFEVRNKTHARAGVLMKEESLQEGSDGTVTVLPESAGTILRDGGDLFVLNSDRILAMTASNFLSEFIRRSIDGEMGYGVSLDSEFFQEYARSKVEIDS